MFETNILNYSKKNIIFIKNILNNLDNLKKDIYFQPEYSLLYENDNKKSFCYYFKDKEKIFFYPFLLQKINNFENYYDIETPYGYGGPIANTNDNLFLKDAENNLNIGLKKLNVIAELIKFHPLIKNHLILKKFYKGKIIKVCKTISLNIEDYDEDTLFNKIYTHANRKSIKKAIKNECMIHISNDNHSWDNFIKLYESNLSNIKASDKYYFKRKYYSMIKDFFEDQYKIFSCKVNNLTISSLLVLYTTNYAHCHLIGSNEFARKLSANNLLHHEVIKWCRRKKIKFLHFGGGYTNEDKDPVLKFKKSFSNQENYFYVGERIINESQYKKICSNIDDKNLFNNNKLLKYRDV